MLLRKVTTQTGEAAMTNVTFNLKMESPQTCACGSVQQMKEITRFYGEVSTGNYEHQIFWTAPPPRKF